MKLSLIVVCCVCVNFAFAGTYTAAVSYANSDVTGGLLSLVYEAGRKNVDILVLPSDATDSEDYDKNVKTLSDAAKQAGLYLVAHLKERTRCQNKQENIRSNLVFDREGSIVAVYRKAENNKANCTTTTADMVAFETDFGVRFGVMMEEDLILSGELKGLKNFVVAGAWSSEIHYLSAPQFSATWSYTHNVNLVSPSGIFAGRAGARTEPGAMRIAKLKKGCDENITTPPVIDAVHIQRFPGEDLSQYIIRPLDPVAGKGYKETVCHNSFCCEFDLKTSFTVLQEEVSYGLAVFDGTRHYGGGKHIGVQSCAVFACAGLYKRSCSFGSVKNNTSTTFEKLSISANFTDQNTAQFPVILSNQHLSAEQFKYITKAGGNVKMTVTEADSLLTFGLFGRVFDRDYEKYTAKENNDDFYNYIFNEDVQEFFDYLWIRVRILMFIVSIYILEML